jgi:hypothetical protein
MSNQIKLDNGSVATGVVVLDKSGNGALYGNLQAV